MNALLIPQQFLNITGIVFYVWQLQRLLNKLLFDVVGLNGANLLHGVKSEQDVSGKQEKRICTTKKSGVPC
jgi:hypothetical protein